MIRAIIVDDLEVDRKDLRMLIKNNHSQDLELVGEADNIIDAMKLIKEAKPDLVFLDVLLNPGTGFDLLENFGFDKIDFKVVFTTKYDQFAIRGYKFSAIDYLVKPVDENELKGAIFNFQKRQNDYYELASQYYKEPENKELEIVLEGVNARLKSYPKDIIRCEADNNYCNIYFLVNSKVEKFQITKTLKHVNEILSEFSYFFRAHKSHLINLNHVKQVHYRNGSSIIDMMDNSQVELSRNSKKEFNLINS